MFYTFAQNNSGGHMVNDESVGLFVIIEADTIEQAVERAENIGLYFDGLQTGRDCRCCGPRWERWVEGASEPEIYGKHWRLPEHYRAGIIHLYLLNGEHLTHEVTV